jgi:hypothetical protein
VAEDSSGNLSVASLLGGVVSNRGAKVRGWVWRETVQCTRTRSEPLPYAVGADTVTTGRLDLIAAVVVPLPRIYAVGHMLVGMPPLSSVGWRCGHWKGVSSVYTVVDTKPVGLFGRV